MDENIECTDARCKANLAHRRGIHSWWCESHTAQDAIAKRHLMDTPRRDGTTKAAILASPHPQTGTTTPAQARELLINATKRARGGQ